MAGAAGAPLVSRGGANRPTIRGGRGRGAAGSRAASARIYGTRRKSSSPAEVVILYPTLYIYSSKRYELIYARLTECTTFIHITI